MKTLTEIDVCKMAEARGGCDLSQAPYRVPDTLSPEMRVKILTAMARAGAKSREVCSVASSLRPSNPLPQREIVNLVLDFIQRKVGYVDDPEGEWYQGAIYTLKNGGDCEDTASLLVSMCACLGVAGRLVWMEQPRSRLNHVTAQVFLPEGGWQWAETTIASAKVGVHPYEAARRHGNAYRITG